MKINALGLELLKSFESCKLKSYKDVGGVYTVGWGHTSVDVKPDMEINQAMADAWLEKDLNKVEKGVESLLIAPISPNRFSACVCFAYNVGLEAFKRSLLLRSINSHQWESAAAQFLVWNHVKGVVVAGLTRRRQAEAALFSTADSL